LSRLFFAQVGALALLRQQLEVRLGRQSSDSQGW
jgi:hypothetical protein